MVSPTKVAARLLSTGHAAKQMLTRHHLDCGGFMIDEEQVRKVLKERVPEHSAEVDRFTTFGGIKE